MKTVAEYLRSNDFGGVAWNINVSDSEKEALAALEVTSFNPTRLICAPKSLVPKLQYSHLCLGMFRQTPTLFAETNFLQLSRVTFTYSNPANIAVINNFARRGVTDLVFVRPVDEKTFISSVNSAEIDGIQIDFSNGRPPYSLKRASLNAAVTRGLMFEIVVGKSLSDKNSLRNMFSCMHVITRFVPLKNILVSTAGEKTGESAKVTALELLQHICFLKIAKNDVHAMKILGENTIELLNRSAARRAQCGNVTMQFDI